MSKVSPQTIAALKEYDSATISNAIEHFELRDRVEGFADLRLKCQFPDYEPMVGFAVTARADSSTPGDKRPQRIGELFDILQAAPSPTILVVQHLGTDRLKSCFFGDMFAAVTQKKFGLVGAVTDAGNRDRSRIRQLAPGYQIFSPGWVVSHGHGAFVDFNVDVTVCGMKISPGDILHGDEDGLLAIPQEIADRVPAQAQEVRKTEEDFMAFLDDDNFNMEELVRRSTAH